MGYLVVWISTVFFISSAWAQSLSMTDVEHLISESKSMDEFVSKLPASYRDSPILIHHSRSPQFSDFQSPRILLTGGDPSSKLIIGVPGTPNPTGNQLIEMIRVVPGGENEFYKANFSSGSPRLERVLPRTAQSPQQDQGFCFNCHRNGRLLWEEADFWMGAYSGITSAHEYKAKELSEYTQFYQSARQQGPYQYLQIPTPAEFSQSTFRERYITLQKISSTNAMEHFAETLRKHPRYREFRFPLLAAILKSPQIWKYRSSGNETEFADFEKTYTQLIEDYRVSLAQKHGATLGITVDPQHINNQFTPWEKLTAPESARVKYILQEFAPEIRLEDFSTSLQKGLPIYGLHVAPITSNSLSEQGIRQFGFFLIDRDPELKFFMTQILPLWGAGHPPEYLSHYSSAQVFADFERDGIPPIFQAQDETQFFEHMLTQQKANRIEMAIKSFSSEALRANETAFLAWIQKQPVKDIKNTLELGLLYEKTCAPSTSTHERLAQLWNQHRSQFDRATQKELDQKLGTKTKSRFSSFCSKAFRP